MAEDLEQKIIKQVEYYFGDYNYPRDKFLQQKSLEEEGWIELSILLTFKRLASLTTDLEVIVKALRKSENGIVCVNEDGSKIRRSPDKPIEKLTEEAKKEAMTRTAYAKGFPLEESLDDIMTFMQTHGPIESCAKRTYLDKATKEFNFKGSCFIVFKDVENCKKFIEADGIKYSDKELIRKWQADYIDEKKQEMQSRRNDRKKKKDEKEQVEVAPPTITFPKGAIIFFSGVTSDVLTREEIKQKITEINSIEPAFIDYKRGDKEGHVRMPKENDAVELGKKLEDGVLEVSDIKLQIKVLEGDEEEQYLKKTLEIISSRKRQQQKGKRNNKRRGYNDGDYPRSKKAKH